MAHEDIWMVTPRQEYFAAMGWTKFADLYEALSEIDQHTEIQADLETTGLNSHQVEQVNSLQIGIQGRQFIFDVEGNPDYMKDVKPILESKLVLGHNMVFDIPYFYKHGIVMMRLFDTFITEWALTKGLDHRPGRERSLEGCLWRYLGVKIDKSEQKDIAEGLTSVEKILYAGRDVVHLFDLRDAMMKTAARRQLTDNVNFENRYLPAHCYLEFCGIMVDKEALTRWIREVECDEMIALRKLEKDYGKINWSSSEQVGVILEEHGIKHIKEETGKYQTGSEFLDKYDLPITRDLSAHREATKMVTTYGRKWYSYILPDGRIHTKYKPIVETGRTACGQVDRRRLDPWDLHYTCREPFPNMQNTPKKRKGFRGIFVPKNGNVLIEADYSGQESVILADQSGDPDMIRLLGIEGRDPHSYVVRIAYPELADLSDEEIKANHSDKRDLIKTGAFAIAYGGNGKTIADNINCTRELGDHIYNSYMDAFPVLKQFFSECYEFAWKRGYMPTDWVTGGKRFFDHATEFREKKRRAWDEDKKYWERYYGEKGENTEWFQIEKEKMKWYNSLSSSLRKESVNTRIQGTGAIMLKLAMIYVFDWIVKEKMFGKIKMVLEVHDALTIETNRRGSEKVAAKLQELMELAGNQCLRNLTIKAEAKILDRLGDRVDK